MNARLAKEFFGTPDAKLSFHVAAELSLEAAVTVGVESMLVFLVFPFLSFSFSQKLITPH